MHCLPDCFHYYFLLSKYILTWLLLTRKILKLTITQSLYIRWPSRCNSCISSCNWRTVDTTFTFCNLDQEKVHEFTKQTYSQHEFSSKSLGHPMQNIYNHYHKRIKVQDHFKLQVRTSIVYLYYQGRYLV